MIAIVLVGGLGTRLRPLTNHVPKPLVPIAGVPLMTRILRRLERHGVRHVILAVQYLADQVRTLYAAHDFNFMLEIVEEPEPLGTGGAVRYALDQAHADPHEPVLVLNGDELSDLDLQALIAQHEILGGVATIAVRHVPDPSAFGVVVRDEHGMVTQFQEKPAAGTALANTINSGAYVFERAALAFLPERGFAMLERDLFPALLHAHQPIGSFLHTAYSQDIGTLAGYLAANEAVLLGKLAHEQPHGIMLKHGVWADATAVIEPGATLIAPIMLGVHTWVGEQAHLHNVIAWERVTIGAHAQLTNCVVACDTTISAGTMAESQAMDD